MRSTALSIHTCKNARCAFSIVLRRNSKEKTLVKIPDELQGSAQPRGEKALSQRMVQNTTAVCPNTRQCCVWPWLCKESRSKKQIPQPKMIRNKLQSFLACPQTLMGILLVTQSISSPNFLFSPSPHTLHVSHLPNPQINLLTPQSNPLSLSSSPASPVIM